MRFPLSPFQTKRHFEMMKIATGKKEVQFLCHDCSVNHHLIQCLWKKRKMAFLNPLQGRNSEKKAATLTTHSSTLGTHSWCFRVQSSKMQQCKPEQSIWEVRISGRQRQSSCRIFLWKEWHALFLCTHLFPCMWNLLEGNVILFPAKSLWFNF